MRMIAIITGTMSNYYVEYVYLSLRIKYEFVQYIYYEIGIFSFKFILYMYIRTYMYIRCAN